MQSISHSNILFDDENNSKLFIGIGIGIEQIYSLILKFIEYV